MQFYNKSILSTLYTNFIDEETEFQDVLSNFLSLKSVSARARIKSQFFSRIWSSLNIVHHNF